jgi:hypothetical protein
MSGISGSYGRFMFSILRSLHIVSKVVILAYVPTTSMWVPFSPHPHQCSLLVVFLMLTIIGVRWNLSVVLICISFMARDGQNFFMCFFSHLDFFL